MQSCISSYHLQLQCLSKYIKISDIVIELLPKGHCICSRSQVIGQSLTLYHLMVGVESYLVEGIGALFLDLI